MKYYLTDKIFIKDNDYYYESDNQENKISDNEYDVIRSMYEKNQTIKYYKIY